VYRLACLLLLIPWTNAVQGQTAQGNADAAPPLAGQALVDRALANELAAAQDRSHLMRYRLRKSSPRLTTTKQIVETRDGDVARLIAINDEPLSPLFAQREEARLNALSVNPKKQQQRKQAEDADTERALNVLRALPNAFLYQDAGPDEGPAGKVEKFTFRPNPKFEPQNLETEVLPAIAGEIWIDPVHLRVTRLEGHVERDVDFGWGILGRLHKGGWIVIEQADVGSGQWRTVHLQIRMSARVIFRTRVFNTTQEQTQFTPVPPNLSYRKAIELLLGGK
jgi:hypothetical protein